MAKQFFKTPFDVVIPQNVWTKVSAARADRYSVSVFNKLGSAATVGWQQAGPGSLAPVVSFVSGSLAAAAGSALGLVPDKKSDIWMFCSGAGGATVTVLESNVL